MTPHRSRVSQSVLLRAKTREAALDGKTGFPFSDKFPPTTKTVKHSKPKGAKCPKLKR